MKKKRIFLMTAIAVCIVLMGVLTGLYVSKEPKKSTNEETSVSEKTSKEKTIDSLTDIEKKIAGIDTENIKTADDDIKEENYSQVYKEYLKLLEEDDSDREIIPRKQDVPIEKIEEIKDIINDNGDTIPESFNLADKIDIKVEDQGMYGLCWDFASIKSLETHLALNNLGNYDLSEMHLDYIESDLMYGYRQLHNGGNFYNFKNYISESGVVLESDVPYREHTEEEYNKFPDMDNVVIVTETVDFPSIYKGENSNYTDEEIAEFRETVKRHIMTNGGLYCGIATPDWGTKYFNDRNSAECFLGDYNDLSKGREFHAVTIVGWDDNYPKENFNEGMRPQNDGAYIFLNSWGTMYGKQGYYYISYEDKYVESDLSGIISTSMDNAYKISSIKNQGIKNYLVNNYRHLFKKYDGED